MLRREEEKSVGLTCFSLSLSLCISVPASLLHRAAEPLSLTQKLNPGFVHACEEAYNLQTDRKEQLSGGMCDGGGDQNDQLTVKEA